MDSTSWNDWKEVEEFYVKEDNFLVDKVIKLNLMNKPYLDSFEDTDNWWKSFEKLLPYFRRVEFAGGEPLMDPQHYKILNMLKPYGSNIEIKYATNGTTIGIKGGRNIHDYWPHFKSVAVNVSVDGLGSAYDYIRGNSDYDEVVKNIKVMQQIPNVRRIVGAVAVQVSNVLILDKMIEEFLDNLGIFFYTKMLRGEPVLLDVTMGQVQGVINFLRANDMNHLWNDCVEFNRRLDLTRKQSFVEVTPEFKKYV
jgi:sulfatase maturation enzyme AslB (radical SAM superfamily)